MGCRAAAGIQREDGHGQRCGSRNAVPGGRMKVQGQTVTVERDDHDFLLELGKQQGTSRILGADSMGRLVERFRPPMEDSMTLPWQDTENSVRFTPGRWSIWSGPSFSGKTQLLRQTILHAAKYGNRRSLFISFEEEPDE